MEMGIVGLGKMGGNMAERLIRRGHRIVGSDPNEAARQRLSALQGVAVSSVKDLIDRLEQTPKVVWSMVPAGEITDNVIAEAAQHLRPGDIVIDGGNSRYTDSQRHYEFLKEKGIRFLDAGTSGGIWGLEEGYCLMVGGDADTFQAVEPLLRDLAPEGGLLHTGPAGSGHYVKMVHNGIEYALMQSYAEGFEILKASPYPNLDLEAICNLWQHGSVVRSWLLELAARAFHQDPNLEKIEGYVEDSGEGRWTVMESIEHAVPAPVIAISLYLRFRSRQPDSFSAKVLAALRNQFGGHPVHPAEKHD
ncbi:MAG TPA: decarboxylating 6-phosphogluconate dehydrogenase [Chthonomonas sp.]|jgi:6-phosphogluconate dehydrogenase|uniref:phosphogluconate dehydrogenase (NAD(+)-dependent, decarboxylating) n=1 Tax=Chthonomonas sp. TaxID=2282153 RepID=UPI002B4B0B2E|nr:decarboxylating 6-phosphogluconate dehydrogenase [Chthonomonas sp.]HLH81406.1 decarboxylating 6-phosphogluconate dehydrogenase [Chthonomonas sp.]